METNIASNAIPARRAIHPVKLEYAAIALDLDGVVTDTQELHFNSWKQVFDEYMRTIGLDDGFTKRDYQLYVDGRPRKEGICSFLSAKNLEQNIRLINRISEQKNELYREMLEVEGPRVFEDSLEAIKKWKSMGLPVVIVSSSKNASFVLEKAGIQNLFEKQVDGIRGEKMGLRGKPEPDFFLEALKELGVNPSDCALVEDSGAGIKAGKKGKFKRVIGMVRSRSFEQEEDLKQNGADQVISSLLEIQVEERKNQLTPPFNALRAFHQIKMFIGKKDIALFLDFDGTLTPIISNPDAVELPHSMKETLEASSRLFKVAIISGRNRQDVKKRVGMENLFYGGSHGFDLSGPGGFRFEVEQAQDVFPALDQAQSILEEELCSYKGIRIERKRYGLTVHYREASPEGEAQAKKICQRIAHEHLELKYALGKKIYELKPNMDWDKGKAIEKLCHILKIDPRNTVPFYIGDDVTDEDAFRQVEGWGLGIRVGAPENSSRAHWWLAFDQVEEFLMLLNQVFGGGEKQWRRLA